MTPWLRAVTAHAGGDKGFYFVPEIGEEVLIGFEGGNAERPFVRGALFHGEAKAAGWGTAQNDVKAIRTRSGHTIELNDADGKEMIVISDKSGDVIHFDTVEKTITVSTPEKINLASKEINIIAEETVNISAKEINAYGEKKVNIASDTQIEEGAPKVTIVGEKNVDISGKMIDVNGQAMTNVKGGMLNLN